MFLGGIKKEYTVWKVSKYEDFCGPYFPEWYVLNVDKISYLQLCRAWIYTGIHPGHYTQKWNFPLMISSVNVTKSAGECRFANIYWRNH